MPRNTANRTRLSKERVLDCNVAIVAETEVGNTWPNRTVNCTPLKINRGPLGQKEDEFYPSGK